MPSWDHIEAMAVDEIEQILLSLPRELRDRALKLPVTFERIPNEGWQADGVEADTLGLFVGEAFPDSASGAVQLPAQIILFLQNLWEFADVDEPEFRVEIRRTYLHELGHYLGLDELGLEERGME
jgi:predicted Zn-dependent protease with MMP-like domain